MSWTCLATGRGGLPTITRKKNSATQAFARVADFCIANELLYETVFYFTTETRFTLTPISVLMRIRYIPVPYGDKSRTVWSASVGAS